MSQGPFEPIYPNPYIVGNPIRSRDMFFGRVDEFRFIARALEDGQKTALIVLFGERRSGKSSILYQILNGELGAAFLPIFVDMQIMAGIANEAEFFSRIIADTCKTLKTKELSPEHYSSPSNADNPTEMFRRFLKDLKTHFSSRSILLLIDEYEILEAKITEDCLSHNVLIFFAGLLESEQVSFVFTGSKRLEMRDEKLWGGELLQKAISRKISFLTKDDTARLVTQPLADRVTFAPEVMAQIYMLTAGQPFYTQLICQNLVYHLNEVKKYHVGSADLQTVVENILENPPPQMIFNWGEHSAERKLVLSLLAEFSGEPGVFLSAHEIRRGIAKSKLELVVGHAQLNSVLAELFQDEYVLQKDHKYGFRLDLFRRWIRHDHNIWQVKKEIGAEELARITKPAEQKAVKRKKARTVIERSIMVVSIVVGLFLLRLLWIEWQKRDVSVQVNGGPFQVVVSDAVDGDTVKNEPGKKVKGKWMFKTRLRKDKSYVFSAILQGNREMKSQTVTIADGENVIPFEFTQYPVTVITDLASMTATLGDTMINTEGQSEPQKCTFYVCAGTYKLRVEDSSTKESREHVIVVPGHPDQIKVNFGRIFIALQAKFPFDYRYKSGNQSGGGSAKLQSPKLYSDIIHGAKTGDYRFTFIDPVTGKRNLLNYQIARDTIITTPLFLSAGVGGTTATAAPRPVTHRLRIETNPSGAEVIWEGKPAEQKTTFVEYFPEGRYSIRLIKAGYDTLDFLIFLNKDTTITKNLVQQTGYLMVTVNAWDGGAALRDAKIYVKKAGESQEQYLGEAGKLANQSAELQVGGYTLRVVRDGFNDERREILIGKGKTERLQITLTKQ